jgi:hypothetical protein
LAKTRWWISEPFEYSMVIHFVQYSNGTDIHLSGIQMPTVFVIVDIKSAQKMWMQWSY